ncbi:MAG TPA: M1 family metallopeptidase [Longimicrobiales bacterium]
MKRLATLALTTTLLAGCAERPEPATQAEPAWAHDIHSYARPAEARVTRVHLDLVADFDARRLAGTAALDIAREAGADSVVLDVKTLEIEAVTAPDGQPLEYALGGEDPILGRPLTVRLPEGVDRIVIRYATSPGAAAVQWLTPAQTAGKRRPFLFTQGQAILTRTWIPTQDSPGIRQTYSARIVVPEGLRAVMSAEMLTPDGEAVDGRSGVRAFRFRMDQPISPYLIALAIGELEFRELGPRTGVYAEPSVVDAAAAEFAEMEEMLAAAERLYGPYRWGRYDVLVLPPSFPFGGMENPRLTFATPTVLAGDRSLVSLVAHELAHSWSGNLVTNATWSDFWLNEGFTSYIENRIMEELRGPEYAAMLRVIARQDLLAAFEDLGGDTAADTRLHIDLAGRDPDAGMTSVPYDKGAAFLRTIELAARRERFDAFLRSYFDRYAFQPMTTERFLRDLSENLIRGDEALAAAIRAEEWAYGTGLPANAPPETSDAFAKVDAQVQAFLDGAAASTLQTEGWSTHEWLHFLRGLDGPLSPERLDALDARFGFTNTGNSEILFEWLRIAIRNRYEPAFPALDRFLTSQGRRKFLRPLYADLVATDWGRPLAEEIYRRARPGYHPVSQNTIDELLGVRR